MLRSGSVLGKMQEDEPKLFFPPERAALRVSSGEVFSIIDTVQHRGLHFLEGLDGVCP